MTTWTAVTHKTDPAAHIRTDVIPFVLTDSDRSTVAQATVQLEAHRRRQNEADGMRSLATWKGSMHRVGEALS